MATAVLALLVVIWFWPLLGGDQLGQTYMLFSQPPWNAYAPTEPLPSRGIFPDVALQHYPWIDVARAQLGEGTLPLWNPYEYGGTTLVGNMQSALFFPLTWLLFAFPLAYAWGVVAALKVLLAGLGTYVLTRELGAVRGGALVAGAAYMLSTPLMLLLQWPLATVFALLPWVLAASVRLARGPTAGRVAALALATGLTVLAGHPESALIVMSAAAILLVALVALERRPPLATLLAWLAAVLLGVAIAAVAVLPFAEAFWPSVTRLEHGRVTEEFDLPWSTLLQFGLPGLFGNGEPAVYGVSNLIYVSGYFGVPALVLAAVALARERRDPGVLAVAILGAAALLATYGVPPVSWFLELVPPWSDSVFGERVYPLVALVAATLAGLGFSSVARAPIAPRQALLAVGCVGAGIGAGLLAAQVAGVLAAPGEVKRDAVLAAAGLLAASGLLLVALGRVPAAAAAVAGVALAAVSLAGPRDLNVMLPPEQAHPPTPASIALLQRQSEPFRLGVIRQPGISAPLLPNTGALYALDGIEGYDFPLSERWSDFQTQALRFTRGKPEARSFRAFAGGAALDALRMMNTRFWLAPPGSAPPAPGFVTVHDGADATVLEDRRALPRAYVTPAIRRVADAAALARVAAGVLDPRREALVPHGAARVPNGGRFQAARVAELAPDHVRVRVPSGARGWLVIASAYHDNWIAEIDGREAALEPTNFAAMGVALPAGAKVVDVRLDRTSFNLGLAISLLALAATGLLVALDRRRLRRAA